MEEPRGNRDLVSHRQPSLRLTVAGAGLLIAASILPLIWRSTHSMKACMFVTESYLKGESLRDYAFHLNDALSHDAATATLRPELVDLERRHLLVAQLRDRLLIAKLVRQECRSKCALDHADSIQVFMRLQEAQAIALARDDQLHEALALLSAPEYLNAGHEFIRALDNYALAFKGDVSSAVAVERRSEHLAIAWVVLILFISVALWIVLLRSVEKWRRRVVVEMQDRVQTQEYLNVTLHRYRDLFDQVPDAILLLDSHTGRVLDANPGASELLGYPHDELLTLTLEDFEAEATAAPEIARPDQEIHAGASVVERRYKSRDGR